MIKLENWKPEEYNNGPRRNAVPNNHESTQGTMQKQQVKNESGASKKWKSSDAHGENRNLRECVVWSSMDPKDRLRNRIYFNLYPDCPQSGMLITFHFLLSADSFFTC